jgi:hypothetical protein
MLPEQFFRTAIALPAHAKPDWTAQRADRIISDFGLVEAALWGALGVQIGYFEPYSIWELISSSPGFSTAWSSLQSQQMIPPGEDLAIYRTDEEGRQSLNDELFQMDLPLMRQPLHPTFQRILLLTSENIYNDSAWYFTASISWCEQSAWRLRKLGIDPRHDSAQEIASGFADILTYWEEMEFALRNAATKPHVDDDPESILWPFLHKIRRMILWRFNLGQAEIVDRYFQLAGEFVGGARDNSPAWADSSMNVFHKLRGLISFFGGEAAMQLGNSRYLQMFFEGLGYPSSEKEAMRAKYEAFEKN